MGQKDEGVYAGLGVKGTRVLVVDDDILILELLKHVLQKEGYEVEIRNDVGSAIAAFDEQGCFDLVITDIVMPGEDGTELAKYVHSMYPGVPVMGITGGVENAVNDYVNFAEMFMDETLAKPFTSKEIVEAARRLMY